MWWQKFPRECLPPLSGLNSALIFFFNCNDTKIAGDQKQQPDQIIFSTFIQYQIQCSSITCFDFSHLPIIGCFRFQNPRTWSWYDSCGLVSPQRFCSQPSLRGWHLGYCSYRNVGDNVGEEGIFWLFLLTLEWRK